MTGVPSPHSQGSAPAAPSFLPSGKASRTPPLSPRPRSPVSLCGPSCRQASPRSPAQAHCAPRQPPRSLPPSAPVQRRLSSLLRGVSSMLGTRRAVSSVRGAERVLGWPLRLAPLLCHLGRPVPRPLPAQPTYHLRAEAWGGSEPCGALLTGGQHGEVGHPRPCPPAFPARSQYWAPPPALRALALSCLPAKRLKVTPVVQRTSQGLGPELSGVIFFFFFFIKK